MAKQLVFLVEEREPCLDDLSSLQSFRDLKLESIEGDDPVILDLLQSVLDDLANGGVAADLHQ